MRNNKSSLPGWSVSYKTSTLLHYIAAIIVREDNNFSLFTVHILSFLCRFVLLAPYSNDPCCKWMHCTLLWVSLQYVMATYSSAVYVIDVWRHPDVLPMVISCLQWQVGWQDTVALGTTGLCSNGCLHWTSDHHLQQISQWVSPLHQLAWQYWHLSVWSNSYTDIWRDPGTVSWHTTF